MKKLLLSLALIFCCTFGIFAQKAFTPSTKSYVNVPILKVFEHRDAYVVTYVNNSNKVNYVSIPKTWFKQGTTEKKGEVKPLQKNLEPYMTICFDNDEFYFIYLSMPVSKLDDAWGVMAAGQGLPAEIDPKMVAEGR